MINIFNEKTVYSGTFMHDFNKVRNKGGNFTKVENSLLYEVIVNKRDYEEAIGKISREKN